MRRPSSAAIVERGGVRRRRTTLESGQAADEQLDAGAALVAGQAGLFLLFTVSFGVNSLLIERENGTLARLRSMPMPGWQIVTAKALVSFVLGVRLDRRPAGRRAAASSTPASGRSCRSPCWCVCVAAAATSVMFLIARVARTSEQAGIATSIVAIVLGIGGGAFFPISAPARCSDVLDLNPVAALLRGLGSPSAGGGLADIGVPVAIMLGFAAVMLLVSRRSRTGGRCHEDAVWPSPAVELRRFLRDRSNIFFVLIFPLLLVLLIGAAVRRGRHRRAGRRRAERGRRCSSSLVEQLEDEDVVVSDGDWDEPWSSWRGAGSTWPCGSTARQRRRTTRVSR